jgi:hypothetical protein
MSPADRATAAGWWGCGSEASSRDGEPDLGRRVARNSLTVEVHGGMLGRRESSGDSEDGRLSTGFFGPEGIYHTRFHEQNQVFIVCMHRINCYTHMDQKCSQIIKYHE